MGAFLSKRSVSGGVFFKSVEDDLSQQDDLSQLVAANGSGFDLCSSKLLWACFEDVICLCFGIDLCLRLREFRPLLVEQPSSAESLT